MLKVVAELFGASWLTVEFCEFTRGSFIGAAVDEEVEEVSVATLEVEWSGTGVTKTVEVSFEAIEELETGGIDDETVETAAAVVVGATVVEVFSSSFLSSPLRASFNA